MAISCAKARLVFAVSFIAHSMRSGCSFWLAKMQIGLHGGVSRVFKPGEHFYSADTLPEGATFDPAVHGHWSCQVGTEPLVTLFVRG